MELLQVGEHGLQKQGWGEAIRRFVEGEGDFTCPDAELFGVFAAKFSVADATSDDVELTFFGGYPSLVGGEGAELDDGVFIALGVGMARQGH